MPKRYRYKGRLRRPTPRPTVKAVARPAVILAAAAAASFAVLTPAQAHIGDHTLRAGDTLSELAASHGTSWQTIYANNRNTIGSDPNALRIGQVLTIGAGSSSGSGLGSSSSAYIVRAGDTLSTIAARHGTTWQQLHALNRDVIGADPNILRVGQRLALDGPAAQTPAVAVSRVADVAASPGAARTSGQDAKSIARTMVANRGWSSSEFTCLDNLWTRESNWNPAADNPTSSAYGIPQALPGSKMATAGADWQTNPATQISWGLGYIADRYGDPCGAWSHFQAHNWY